MLRKSGYRFSEKTMLKHAPNRAAPGTIGGKRGKQKPPPSRDRGVKGALRCTLGKAALFCGSDLAISPAIRSRGFHGLAGRTLHPGVDFLQPLAAGAVPTRPAAVPVCTDVPFLRRSVRAHRSSAADELAR